MSLFKKKTMSSAEEMADSTVEKAVGSAVEKGTEKAVEETTVDEKPTDEKPTDSAEGENKPTDSTEDDKKVGLKEVTPQEVGKLDMVIAFDTTGSMASYIDDVRQQVADLIPRLFKDNGDLRIGIVAFGDYCDMNGKNDFGDAYQCLPLTNNENDIIRFIRKSKDTSGGDGDEFYELVIKKIVEESAWREDAIKNILLISDAEPHELGYTYKDYVVGNQIDWQQEAKKAAEMKIKIDTVTIRPLRWYKELSEMTNGVSVPFYSSNKTADMIYAGASARSSFSKRAEFDAMERDCLDEEMKKVYACYRKAREEDF